LRSQIVKANGEPVNVDYMMRRNGDGWLTCNTHGNQPPPAGDRRAARGGRWASGSGGGWVARSAADPVPSNRARQRSDNQPSERPRTRSSNPVPSSRESTNVRSLSDSWSGQRIVGLTRKRSFVPGMLTTAQANSSSSAFASFWFESSPLQRRVRCEPIFPPVQKAAPKTRGGAHEPLTQIKQFLSAAHHLLSK
jgi:hypothetical protein